MNTKRVMVISTFAVLLFGGVAFSSNTFSNSKSAQGNLELINDQTI